MPLTPPGFHFDPEVLEDAFRQRPKALILCNPSNPCDRVFTQQEPEVIAALVEKYDAYVITDEVYEHIVYAPHQHTYFAALPGMRQRTISCSSPSKAYSITGRRLAHTTQEGAYYVLLDISEFGYDSDLKFCEDLAEKVGVEAAPESSFFREPVNHLILFHFAKRDETLLGALNWPESLREKFWQGFRHHKFRPIEASCLLSAHFIVKPVEKRQDSE